MRDTDLHITAIDGKAIIGKFGSVFPLPRLDAALRSELHARVSAGQSARSTQ